MSNDQAKNSAPVQEHTYPAIAPYQHFNGANSYPPPGPYPIYGYPPPSEGGHVDGTPPNGAHPGAPYMMYPPPAPGVLYYPGPPSGQAFPQFTGTPSTTSSGNRPKRKQVKMACTNCATACKRCDEARPCERCVKYGISETCVDGVRKERKKGVKRGPYKRKNKQNSGDAAYGDPEWQPSGSPNSPPAVPPAMHALPPFPPPEGYWPYMYPPPAFMPPGHEGHPGHEGVPNGNGQPPMLSYYPVPPPGYPPFPHYAHPGTGVYSPHHPNGAPVQPPAEAASHADSQSVDTDSQGRTEESPPAPSNQRKRTRTSKNGEPKAKKAKTGVGAQGTKAANGAAKGDDQISDDHGGN